MNAFEFDNDMKAHVRYMMLMGGEKCRFTFNKIPGSYDEFVERTTSILEKEGVILPNDCRFLVLISNGKILNPATYFHTFRNRENPPTIIVTSRRVGPW